MSLLSPSRSRLRGIFFIVLFVSFFSGARTLIGAQGEIQRPVETVVPSGTDKATAQASLEKAEQLYRTYQFEAAAEAFRAIIKSDEESVLAYVGLVRVYLKQKKPVEANLAALKVAKLAPTLDAVRVVLGEVYFRQGKMAEAETEFANLARANTREPRAYLGLSRVYEASSYHKRAKRAIDLAHALDPADPEIQQAWIRTVSRADQIKTLQTYLAAQTNDDGKRRRLEEQLEVLQNEVSHSVHPCHLATPLSQAEIKMAQLNNGANLRGFGLSVKINGVSSKLLLDTGAGGLVLNRKLAERAGVKQLGETYLKGVGDKGVATGYVGYADSIKIGALEFQDCYVRVIDRDSVLEDEGLIGTDVFSDFLVELDFPNGKLRLSELPPRPEESAAAGAPRSGSSPETGFKDRYVAPAMKEFTPVYRFGHLLLIQTRLNNLPGKLFLIDTGAFNNTISPAAAREVTRVSGDADTRVKGVSGAVKNVFRAEDLTFQFGYLRQRNRDVVAFDTHGLSDSIGTEVSGTLGFAMLWLLVIKIDYRDGLVNFTYDPSQLVNPRWRR